MGKLKLVFPIHCIKIIIIIMIKLTLLKSSQLATTKFEVILKKFSNAIVAVKFCTILFKRLNELNGVKTKREIIGEEI